MKNLNTDAANLPRNLERAIGFSASKLETDRHHGPVKDEDSDDSGNSDDDEDDDGGPPCRFRNYEWDERVIGSVLPAFSFSFLIQDL